MQNVSDSLNDIFELLLYFDLLNVNVLIKNEEKWYLYFFKPYIKSCHLVEPLHIDTFTSKNYTNELNTTYNDLFPLEHFKFNYCKIKVATFPLEPNVLIESLRNGTSVYTGVDIMIVNEICKTLNLIPIYVQSPDGQNRGVIFPNGTVTGAMNMVSFEKCNCIIITLY